MSVTYLTCANISEKTFLNCKQELQASTWRKGPHYGILVCIFIYVYLIFLNHLYLLCRLIVNLLIALPWSSICQFELVNVHQSISKCVCYLIQTDGLQWVYQNYLIACCGLWPKSGITFYPNTCTTFWVMLVTNKHTNLSSWKHWPPPTLLAQVRNVKTAIQLQLMCYFMGQNSG